MAKNRLYMEVTRDKYALPLAVAGSVEELARLRDIKVDAIRSSMNRAKAYKKAGSYPRYLIVEIDEESGANE